MIAAALGRAWVPTASKHSQYYRFEKVIKSVTLRIMDLGTLSGTHVMGHCVGW
jgi:hypothetical protein